MPNQYEREEAVRRAKGMVSGGFDAQYLYQKFISEKFSEDEAVAIVREATGKPFSKPIQAEAPPKQEPKAAEMPLSFAPAPQAKQEEASPSSEAPVSLASLMGSPAAEVKDGGELSERLESVVETMESKEEAPQAEASPSEAAQELQASSEAPAPAPVPSASTPKPSEEFRRKEALRIAAALFNTGYDANYIVQKLVKAGYNRNEAATIVSSVTGRKAPTAYAQAANNTGRNDPRRYDNRQGADGSTQVIIGVVMILIGCGVTFFSYQAAANSPSGGTYVVTFGLIIAGAFRVLKGLSS